MRGQQRVVSGQGDMRENRFLQGRNLGRPLTNSAVSIEWVKSRDVIHAAPKTPGQSGEILLVTISRQQKSILQVASRGIFLSVKDVVISKVVESAECQRRLLRRPRLSLGGSFGHD
jgi:hypothetical protein